MPQRSIAEQEKFRQDLKSALERLRAGIQTRIHPRDQGYLLATVDRIQEFINTKQGELEQIQGTIQRSKDSTRRFLRSRPSDMVQLLNELDGIEQDVVQFVTKVLASGA